MYIQKECSCLTRFYRISRYSPYMAPMQGGALAERTCLIYSPTTDGRPPARTQIQGGPQQPPSYTVGKMVEMDCLRGTVALKKRNLCFSTYVVYRGGN